MILQQTSSAGSDCVRAVYYMFHHCRNKEKKKSQQPSKHFLVDSFFTSQRGRFAGSFVSSINWRLGVQMGSLFFFFFPLTVVIRKENVFTIRQCLLWSWTASAEPHSVFCQYCGLRCLLVLLVSAVIWINTGPPHQPSGCLLLCCFCPLITSQKFPAQARHLNMPMWLTVHTLTCAT